MLSVINGDVIIVCIVVVILVDDRNSVRDNQ